jgi:hypothetical protein
MLITKLALKNWRNFREAEMVLRDCSYLVGADYSIGQAVFPRTKLIQSMQPGSEILTDLGLGGNGRLRADLHYD